jgi:hypothetical protein
MRAIMICVLALFGLGTLADDASALGKRGRKRGRGNDCGAVVAPAPSSCCGAGYGQPMYGQPMYGQPWHGQPGVHGGMSYLQPGQPVQPSVATVGYPVSMPSR